MDKSVNVLTADNVTLSEDSTTAEEAAYSAFNFSFSISSGDIGSVAVWEITAEANKRYFVATRTLSGRGEWSVSTEPESQNGSDGFIETDGSGLIYLRLTKYSQEAVTLLPVLIIPAENLTQIDAGASAAPATVKFNGSKTGIPSFALILNNSLEVFSSEIDFTWALFSGRNVAALMLLRGTATGALEIAWKKVEL